MLNLRTFGGCHLERDGVRLDELSAQRKALALLALLACAGARGMTRDVAAAFLWPEGDEQRSRASLKQLVHSLRTRLGTPDVLLTSGDLRLNPVRVTSDVAEFNEALRSGERAVAARLYSGPFLEGFYLRSTPAFEQWASEQRAALARGFTDAVRQLAEEAGQQGDHAAAARWWRRLLESDRLSVQATLGLMRALDSAGERAAAIRQGSEFQALVRAELEVEANPAVMELAVRLRSAPVASASRPVLVVLPLANTGTDADDEHFCDGLTDELIGTIGKLRGIAVVGRTSAFALKEQRIHVADLAARVGASHVLEGSVRRGGDRIKVGVQLVRSADGVVLWSEIYDRHARDLFAVQAEIARAVSVALRAQLDPAGAPGARAGTTDTEAQDLYLRGRFFLNRTAAADLRQSIACFARAVERDPSFARAYAGLADAHLLLAIMGHSPAGPEVSRVHAALTQALALDGQLAEAHSSLACVLFAFDWEWGKAEREFTTAIELDPGYGLAHHRYGLFLMYQRRFDEAQGVLERARVTDPLAASVNMNLGRLHLAAQRPERALPLLQTATELSPQFALAHEHLGQAYLALESCEKALAAYRRVAELSGARGATRLAWALAVTGGRAEARALVHSITRRAEASTHAFGLAMAHAGLGKADDAFQWLERAYAQRDAFLHTLQTVPAFEPLHGDARWPALLRRTGLLP